MTPEEAERLRQEALRKIEIGQKRTKRNGQLETDQEYRERIYRERMMGLPPIK